MEVFIKLTTAGVNTGPTFTLFEDGDGYTSAFAVNIPKATLLIGDTYTLLNTSTIVMVVSDVGLCDPIYIPVVLCTTTTSTTLEPTTTTSSSTPEPPTTTTTTTAEPGSIFVSLIWDEAGDAECGPVGEGCGLSYIRLGGSMRLWDEDDNGYGLPQTITIPAGSSQPQLFSFNNLPASKMYKLVFSGITMTCNITEETGDICSKQWSDTGHGMIMQDPIDLTGDDLFYGTSAYSIGTTFYIELKAYFPGSEL